MITLTGKKISEGIAIGKLTFYKRDIKEIKRIYVKDVEKEIQRYKKAREKAIAELELVYDLSVREVGEANAAIFEMQKELLENQEYTDFIMKRILEEKLNAEYIVQTSVEQLIRISSHQQNNPIQGKEEDVRDVAIRVIRILSRSWKDRMLTDEPFVMAARDIYPSEALQFDKAKVLGFVTMYGTINSHTAVLARTKGIPAVIGLGESLKEEYDGKTIIIDGYEGKIYIEPDYATLTKMRERKDANLRHVRNLERLKGKENITQSGQRIDICANVGTREDIENVLRSDAGGIGLFRSEFLYMEMGSKLPSEEQLFQVYKLAAESMGANRVVVRIADFGGDKMVESVDLGEQANPAIGLRGIRIMMEKEELFLPQFRAILRASALGNVSIMFPMVTSMEEVAAAKALLEKAKKLTINPRCQAAIARLEEVYEVLKLYGYEKYVSFDLGMVNHFDYYTGIIFRGYTYGTGDAIGKGGRYDNLLAQFGKEASASGFTILIDGVLSALSRQNISISLKEYAYSLLLYKSEDRQNAIPLVVKLRDAGVRTELVSMTEGKTLEEYLAFGKNQGAEGILYLDGENVTVYDMASGEQETKTLQELREEY